VRAAAEAAGVPLPLDALWAGLAGAGSEEERRAMSEALSAAGLAAQVSVGTDVEAAFHSAFGSGPGVLLLAGTGSVSWARGPSGETVRVGGWGERLGDEGSGYAIGLKALRAVVRAHDGRGATTRLTAGVLEAVGRDEAEQLVGWIASAEKGDVAALVPVVVSAEAVGDPVAREILVDAAAALRLHLEAILERAGPWPEPPDLVLWGGLLQEEGAPLRQAVERLVAELPLRLRPRRLDAALGAAHLALSGL
jgi:N-acetylglucosamine kinase-like BadF-type ATPase